MLNITGFTYSVCISVCVCVLLHVPVLDGFGCGGGSEFGHEDPYYVEEEHEIYLSE